MKSMVLDIGKCLELMGMFCMPVALFYGLTLEGSGGMIAEMAFLGIGVGIFFSGRLIGCLGARR